MIKIPRVLNSFGVWTDPVFHAMLERDMVIGVRDEFHSGGGGGRSLLPNIFSIANLKIKWFCPNITFFLNPEMAIWKILGGCILPSSMALTPLDMVYRLLDNTMTFVRKINTMNGSYCYQIVIETSKDC